MHGICIYWKLSSHSKCIIWKKNIFACTRFKRRQCNNSKVVNSKLYLRVLRSKLQSSRIVTYAVAINACLHQCNSLCILSKTYISHTTYCDTINTMWQRWCETTRMKHMQDILTDKHLTAKVYTISYQSRRNCFLIYSSLTHWGRVTHICVDNLSIIGSDNGLSPGRRQAITWTNVGILLIGPLRTNFTEMVIEIHTFSFKKILLKVSSGKWRPFCLGLNVLIALC